MDRTEFPLFPELSEEGAEEAQRLMDGFKVKIAKVCQDVLDDLYTDVSCYIESDHWTNYRNKIMDGLKYYPNNKKQGQYDFKAIRQSILKEHAPEIIADLNADMLEEIAKLEKELQYEREYNRR